MFSSEIALLRPDLSFTLTTFNLSFVSAAKLHFEMMNFRSYLISASEAVIIKREIYVRVYRPAYLHRLARSTQLVALLILRVLQILGSISTDFKL